MIGACTEQGYGVCLIIYFFVNSLLKMGKLAGHTESCKSRFIMEPCNRIKKPVLELRKQESVTRIYFL